MGITDWYRRDIRLNNDAPRLRFTNTEWYYDKPLGAFADAVLDRLEKAGPTQHQWERSHMFAEKVAAERTRNSMRWKYRLVEWITWKIPLCRRFYNTEVNEATGALHRSIVDPRNGQKYLLTSPGRFTRRALRGWDRRAPILNMKTGQPIDPELQRFLQKSGVYLGRNTWDYHNQVGRIRSEMRGVGTPNERECMRFIILPHDNNSGPMEALEDGTDLYVRAYNSNGQWVALTPELQDRLFTHGYAKYPHYPAAIMQFLGDAWARATSDLVTQRRLLEMQREAEFGEYAAHAARDALGRDKWVTVNLGGGPGGSSGPPPPTYGQSGTAGPHQPPAGPYPGGSSGPPPPSSPYPGGSGGSQAYYANVGSNGQQHAVWQNDLPGYYGVGQEGYPPSSRSGDGPQFRPTIDQLAAWMGTDQQTAAHTLSSILGTVMGTVPNVVPAQQAPTSGAGQGTGASLDDRVWWTDAGRSGQAAGPRSNAPAGTAPSR